MPAIAKGSDTVSFRNTAAHRHKGVYERDPDDFYVEERGCTEALLDYEHFFGVVYDPCAGSGNIVDVCAARRLVCYASDVVNRGGLNWVVDFVAPGASDALPRIDNIITNPPFRKGLILPIIERAIDVARHKVAVLVPAPFLYSIERYDFFQRHRPKLILHFSSRPSMPPGKMLADGIIKATGGKEDYSWIVFSSDHRGGTLTDWILLPEAARKRGERAKRAAAEKAAASQG